VNRIPLRRTGLRRALTASLAVGITLGVAASAQATFPGANGKIAYSVFDGTNSRHNVFVINADGTGVTNLTGAASVGGINPEWSPDGSRIVFATGTGGDSEVHAMDPDGANRVTLYTAGRSPVFSPDGTRIAYIDNVNAIRIANADGSGVIPFTSPAGITFTTIDWSPDGTTIAARGEPTAGGIRIYLVNVSTGVATPLVGGDGANYDDLEWSSDGGKVFYHRNDNDLAPPTVSSDVWSINADGTGNTQLTTAVGGDRFPAPSPDGTAVAFASSSMRVMNPDGTGNTVLAGIASGALDWQPVEAVDPPVVVPPVVSKTASPQVSREITWEVLKSANLSKAGWDKKDSSVGVSYRVEVNRSVGAPGKATVTGGVLVKNPNAVPMVVTEVEDALPGARCKLVSSPGPVAAGGETLVGYSCSFSSVPSTVLTNTATVFWSVGGVAGTPVSATAPVDFSAAQTVFEGPKSVMVTDTLGGDTTRVLAEELTESKIFRYTRYMKATAKCRTFDNTARLLPVAETEAQGGGVGPVFPVTPFVIDKDHASVRICPPAKDDPSPKDPPVVIIDNGDGAKPTPVPTKPVDNPAGPVITNPKSTGKMVVIKRADTKRAQIGDTVIWSITVRNAGTADLDDVVLTDRLPKHLRVISSAKAPLAKGTKANSRLVKMGVGDLLVGGSVTVKVATRVIGKPALTPQMVRETSRAKDRDLQRNRARRGIACNLVSATAVNAPTRGAISCIRITRPAPMTDPVIT